jgi:arylsulfatase
MGPLTTKRMERVDEEFVGAALDFMDRKTKQGVPWFTYVNTTRMHVWIHLKPSSQGVTDLGVYPDGMVELDGYVGQLLKKVDNREGGFRVPMLIRRPGVIKPGTVVNDKVPSTAAT